MASEKSSEKADFCTVTTTIDADKQEVGCSCSCCFRCALRNCLSGSEAKDFARDSKTDEGATLPSSLSSSQTQERSTSDEAGASSLRVLAHENDKQLSYCKRSPSTKKIDHENPPIDFLYCDRSATNLSLSPAMQRSADVTASSYPLSMVEEYVRCYALNLPTPFKKHQREEACHSMGVPAGSPRMPSKQSNLPSSRSVSSAQRFGRRNRIFLPSPGSTPPVRLSCLDAPAVTATELWERQHEDCFGTEACEFAQDTAKASGLDLSVGTTTMTPTSAMASASGVGPRTFHKMDPSTVALLGDRKRYRVNMGGSQVTEGWSSWGHTNESDRRNKAAGATPNPSDMSTHNASYTIRVVHELTGCVGSTIPVATLVARHDIEADPIHDAKKDRRGAGGSSSVKKRRRLTLASPTTTVGGVPIVNAFRGGSQKSPQPNSADLRRSDAGRLV